MPKQIRKSLQVCLSKIKISNKRIRFQLRSCKHPKTPSFSVAGKAKEDTAVTLSDIDQFLFENFRSLYEKEYEEEETSHKNKAKTATFLFESRRLLDSPPPQPEKLCGTTRFFVPSGLRSSLITDEAFSASASSTTDSTAAFQEAEELEANDYSTAPDDFITLLTYSQSPHEDFRRSMQEIVEARMEHNGKVDWEFLQELLFSYLDLNNKKSYRFVLRAFVDLIVVLRENSGTFPASLRPWNGEAERRWID